MCTTVLHGHREDTKPTLFHLENESYLCIPAGNFVVRQREDSKWSENDVKTQNKNGHRLSFIVTSDTHVFLWARSIEETLFDP